MTAARLIRRPSGLSYADARLVAMAELGQMYDTLLGRGEAEIEARTRWYMLTRDEQWRKWARAHACDLRRALQRGDRAAADKALAFCKFAVGKWREERRPSMAAAAE